MSKLGKKIFVSAVAAMMVATIAAPSAAQAQTAAELQAQIQSLLATIAQLQAQIAALQGGAGVTGIPAGFTFTQNLSQGSSGTDVMYLQMLLNSNAATQVASSGAGSPGSETQFYGPLTTAAVTKFHNTYASEILAPLGLTAGTGFFGPSSRAKANALLATGAVPTPTPTPTTPTPTPTPTPPPVISTPGQEGNLVVTIASTPASGVILDTEEVADITGVDVKATDGDVLVSRLDLEFDTRPWLYLSELKVSDGTTSQTVSVTKANSTEVTVGSKYSVRVSNLDVLIPQDTTKTLTVTGTAVNALPVGTTTKDIVLTFIANSIRGVDGAGLTQEGPTASLATRTITVQEPTKADIEVTAHSDNPKARNVKVNSTAETTDVELAKFNLKAKNNDAIVRTVEFTDTTASGTLNVVYLYDGNTLLSSTGSIGTASSVLENVDLTIPKDTTKTLTLKADVKKATGNYEEGASSTIAINAESTSVNAEDGTSFATATISGSNVSPGVAYFYSKMPEITLASTSVVGIEGTSGSASPQSADATIKINVKAVGGDIYVRHDNSTVGSSGLHATTSVPASLTVTQTFGTNAASSTGSGGWLIRSGETKWFEYNVNMLVTAATGNDTDFFAHAKPVHIIWGTADDTTWAAAMPQTWVVDEFRTSEILLKGAI